MASEINRLNVDEFDKFANCDAIEKLMVFSAEGCQPCETLMEDLGQLKKDGTLSDMVVFKMQFPMGEDYPADFAEEVGVRHFPTVLYYVSEICVGRLRGLLPHTDKSSAVSLLNWLAKTKKKAA